MRFLRRIDEMPARQGEAITGKTVYKGRRARCTTMSALA